MMLIGLNRLRSLEWKICQFSTRQVSWLLNIKHAYQPLFEGHMWVALPILLQATRITTQLQCCQLWRGCWISILTKVSQFVWLKRLHGFQTWWRVNIQLLTLSLLKYEFTRPISNRRPSDFNHWRKHPQVYKEKPLYKFGIREAFQAIKLIEESSMLTVMHTCWGRYRWTRLPFGVSSGPDESQRPRQDVMKEGTKYRWRYYCYWPWRLPWTGNPW